MSAVFLVDEIIAQLADHPQSLAELSARLFRSGFDHSLTADAVREMADRGGIVAHTNQDGVTFYGLGEVA